MYEKEQLEIIAAIDRWRHYIEYIQGRHFIIKSEHFSFKYLEQKVTTVIQQKDQTKLLGQNYVIQYGNGSENRVADALSRIPKDQGETYAIYGVLLHG